MKTLVLITVTAYFLLIAFILFVGWRYGRKLKRERQSTLLNKMLKDKQSKFVRDELLKIKP